jgi:hypothetical protein
VRLCGAGCGLTCQSTTAGMAGCGLAWPSACSRRLPVRLPGISLPELTTSDRTRRQSPDFISGRGRPGLRLAAWRAVWAAMPNNPVMAARFGPPASPDRLRGRPAALDPCRGHPPRHLGSRHRRRGPARRAGPGPEHEQLEPAPNVAPRQDPGGASPDAPRGTHLAHENGQPLPPSQQARFTLSGNKPA